ncbi:hypothetical protein AQ476_26145 [Burkholderia thailandensis]|nr:hypothetical protein AQ476_26145 [Burkholderia thailandensis]
MPHACGARRRRNRPSECAKPRRPDRRDIGLTVWPVGDSMSNRCAATCRRRAAAQSRTFRTSRVPPRFSRYRRSRPLIPYLNISAISV